MLVDKQKCAFLFACFLSSIWYLLIAIVYTLCYYKDVINNIRNQMQEIILIFTLTTILGGLQYLRLRQYNGMRRAKSRLRSDKRLVPVTEMGIVIGYINM